MHQSSRRAGGARPAGAPPLPVVATGAGSAAVARAPALPWAASGRTVRSGFALAQLARNLGLVSSWPARGLLLGVAGLPLLAALAWTAVWLGRRRLAAAAGAVSGAVALAGAAVVWQLPLRAGVGPAVSVAAGAIALVGAFALARSEETRWKHTISTG